MKPPVCVSCQLSEVANKVNICVQILIAAPRLSSFCDTRPIKPCPANCLFTSVCFLLPLSKTEMADSSLYAECGFQLKVFSPRQDRAELELSKFKAVYHNSLELYSLDATSAPQPHQSLGYEGSWGTMTGVVRREEGGFLAESAQRFYAKSEMETSSHFPFPVIQRFQAPTPPRSL